MAHTVPHHRCSPDLSYISPPSFFNPAQNPYWCAQIHSIFCFASLLAAQIHGRIICMLEICRPRILSLRLNVSQTKDDELNPANASEPWVLAVVITNTLRWSVMLNYWIVLLFVLLAYEGCHQWRCRAEWLWGLAVMECILQWFTENVRQSVMDCSISCLFERGTILLTMSIDVFPLSGQKWVC